MSNVLVGEGAGKAVPEAQPAERAGGLFPALEEKHVHLWFAAWAELALAIHAANATMPTTAEVQARAAQHVKEFTQRYRL